jgi:predicted site-specific integrase-resolvase
MSYVSATEASKFYKVHPETLREWANLNRIEFRKTPGGHRRYKIFDEKPDKKNYIYARVSSKKQEGDLQRQVKYLIKKYPSYEVITDIASGLNFKRKGFRRILEQLYQRNIGEVVVSTQDRFSRLGATELFEWMFDQFGGKLTILNQRASKSSNEELAEELLEVITVFTARYHGRRSYSNNKKSKNLPKQPTEKIIQ